MMRFKEPILVALFAFGVSAIVLAAPSPDGRKGAEGSALGLFVGQPTGISYRLGIGNDQSFEAKAAWDLADNRGGDASFIFQANWLLEFPGVLVVQKEDFPLYVGAGVQADLGSATSLGFRIPGGVMYRFAKAPIELCLEIGLGMQLFPSTAFVSSGGLGARYRF
jgi:hypothetical protein